MNRLLNSALLILFGFLLGGWLLLVAQPPRGTPVTLKPAPPAAPIFVHVTGEVSRPGVYELPAGARVRDAIAAAGGFTGMEADYTVNLAEVLEDGTQVLISRPALPVSPGAGSNSAAAGERIDINTATQAQLETLPGIGPSIAQRIIEYREQNGAFGKVSEIVRVSGIGPSTYEKIKNLITTGP